MRTTRQHAITFSLTLLLAILSGAPAWAQDPGTAGPLAVTVQEYNFGDTAFNPPSGFPGPVEVRGQVHRPTNLAGGPFPLLIFLHGRHGVCSGSFTWPCPAGQTMIPSYQGYAYVASILASHGYIVVSISANGINAQDNGVFDLGAQARADLIQHHLDIWNNFNTSGGAPFGTTFVGKVDMDNVGTMGHSRGGEGVMRHVLHNRSLGSPYTINAVFPLAPVDFNRPIVNDVAFNVLLPYCDGDVSDLQGVHFYDDARYSDPGDITPKHTVLVMGANHNFYNTVWTPPALGASDDWGTRGDPVCDAGSPGRLTAAQQRGTGLAYMAAFFRVYIGGETQFAPILKGDVAPPPSAMSDDIFPSYHAPDSATQRRDVNRWLVASHLTTNQLGGAVTQSGFTPNDLCGGELPQPQHCNPTQSTSRQPHTTPSARSAARGLSQLRGGWSAATAHVTNALPAGSRDVSAFQVFQFRVSVNYNDVRNPVGVAQNLVVRLTDGTGATADAQVSSHSPALFYPPGQVSAVPKVVLNTVRIPISAFTGINLTDVRTVALRFNQTASGALLMTDFAFADSAGPPPVPPDLVVTAVTNPPATIPAGGNFNVTATTRNQGAGGAAVSTTRFLLSIDQTRSAGDVLLTGTDAVPALAPATEASDTTNVTVPAGTAANTYFLLACADDPGVIAESNEGNNCRASTGTVQVQAPAGADLVVSALSNPPPSAIIGSRFSLSITTTNQGGSDVLVTTVTRVYLSLDTVRDAGDKRMGGQVKIVSLASGASFVKVKNFLVKTSQPPGEYFVIACADATNTVAEGAAGESNNCRTSTTKVTVHF